MPRSRYKYDPEQLHYNELDNSLGARFWRGMVYVAAIVVIAILLNVVYSLFFDTPGERQIRRENEMLLQQYQALEERKQRVDTVMKEIREIDRDIYRVIFETEPVTSGMPLITGSEYRALLNTSPREIVEYTAWKSDSLMALNQQTAPLYDIVRIRGENRMEMLPKLPAIQPIRNQDLSLIASGYGYRVHPIYKIPKMHSGIDFSAPVGTPVMATGGGVVESVIRSGRGLGNRVTIDHGFGYRTLYACMDEIEVRQGDAVSRGERIGTVGESGLSVAPHLHYEVHLNGEPVNPINYFFLELGPAEYDRLILISMMSGQSFD